MSDSIASFRFQFTTLYQILSFHWNNNLYFLKGALKGHVIDISTVNSLVECGLNCASLLPDSKSINYITKHPGQSAICEIDNSSKSHVH